MKKIKIENILYSFQLMVLNTVFFNRIVNKWNGLPNHIRKSNSIATFKKNVLSFIKDN